MSKKIWLDYTQTERNASYVTQALSHSDNWLGVSTVFGEKTAAVSADEWKQFAEKQLPVVCGFEGPIAAFPNEENHRSPVAGMKKELEKADAFWIVCLGPLTNIAAFLHCEPEIAKRIEGILILGGGAFTGDARAGVEKSFAADPEAASIVLQSGLPLFLIPYEMQTNPLLLAEELETWDWEESFVEVDLWGVHTRGASIIDFGSKISGKKKNARVLTGKGGQRILAHGH